MRVIWSEWYRGVVPTEKSCEEVIEDITQGRVPGFSISPLFFMHEGTDCLEWSTFFRRFSWFFFQLKKFLRCNDDKVVLNYGPTGLKLINWTTNIVQHSNHAVTLYVNDKKEAIIRGHL